MRPGGGKKEKKRPTITTTFSLSSESTDTSYSFLVIMSSYADAAASSGPIGAKKIPEPTKVEHTTPEGNIETVPEQKFDKLKKQAEKKLEQEVDTAELKKDAKAYGKRAKDFEKRAEKEGKDLLALAQEKLSATYSYVSNYLSNFNVESRKTVAYAQSELENPVVVLQTIAGIGGLVAGYVTYLERHRIRTDSNIVLGIHGAIITGLVGLDVYLFGKYYPKYDKKTLRR